MDIDVLRVFVSLAEVQNMHAVAKNLRISVPTVSKIIQKLEDELGCRLFERVGRGVQLNATGDQMRQKANLMIALADDLKLSVVKEDLGVNCVIAGREVLLGHFAKPLMETVRRLYPQSRIRLINCDGATALQKTRNGDSHFAITVDTDHRGGKRVKVGNFNFVTVVGVGHPLYRKARSGERVPIDQVMSYEFVAPVDPFFGRAGSGISPDGWRDDKFPRKIGYSTDSIHLFDELVESGAAIAYLPEYHASSLKVARLHLDGCPYRCEQTVTISAEVADKVGWIGQVLFQVSKVL
jgi:DNA-binding transcriptional LysR family regulator